MSNYMPPQPPPPGYPPAGMGYDEPAMPPMGQRTNGWAIASLICGILFCVPALTSLCATIFGILGIRKSNQPYTGGRGIAIAGLVLGILGLLGWAAAGVGSYVGYRWADRVVFSPSRQTGTAFITSLGKGDVATARSHTTGQFAAGELEGLSEQIQPLGAYRGYSVSDVKIDSETGQDFQFRVEGTLRFENGTRGFAATFVGGPDAGAKVQEFKLR